MAARNYRKLYALDQFRNATDAKEVMSYESTKIARGDADTPPRVFTPLKAGLGKQVLADNE